MNSQPSVRNSIFHFNQAVIPLIHGADPKTRCNVVRQLAIQANNLLFHYTNDTTEQSVAARVKTYGDCSVNLKNLATNLHLYVCPKHYQERRYAIDVLLQSVSKCLALSHLEYQKRWLIVRDWNAKSLKSADTPDYRIKSAAFRLMDEEPFMSAALNGDTITRSSMRLHEDLAYFLSTNRDNLSPLSIAKIEITLKRLETLSNFAKLFNAIGANQKVPNLNQLISDGIFTIKLGIDQLKPGEEMLLPGGYQATGGGHCVIYIIQRTDLGESSLEQRKYLFKIGNRGEASVSSPSILSSPFNIPPNVCYDHIIQDISHENITSETLWRELILANTVQDYAKSFTDIKQYLLLQLGKETFKKGRFHPFQSNGNCTYESVTLWLQDALGDDLYPFFDLSMKELALGYLRYVRDVHSTNPSIQQTVSKLTAVYKGQPICCLDVILKLIECGEANFTKINQTLTLTQGTLTHSHSSSSSSSISTLGIHGLDVVDTAPEVTSIAANALGSLAGSFSEEPVEDETDMDATQTPAASSEPVDIPTTAFEYIGSPFSPKMSSEPPLVLSDTLTIYPTFDGTPAPSPFLPPFSPIQPPQATPPSKPQVSIFGKLGGIRRLFSGESFK